LKEFFVISTTRAESPFSESEEQQLAADLLAVNNERELDRFIWALLRRAADISGGKLHVDVGGRLGGLVRIAIQRVLPGVGRGFDVSLASQSKQTSADAEALLGFESEGLSAEDRELNSAMQIVRLVGTAAEAASHPGKGEPEDVARAAMIEAAQRHAPGLVRSRHRRGRRCDCGQAPASCSCREAESEFRERRGRRVAQWDV
jgi:hypothetical protein